MLDKLSNTCGGCVSFVGPQKILPYFCKEHFNRYCACINIKVILAQSHEDECLVPNEFRPRRSQLEMDGLLEDPK